MVILIIIIIIIIIIKIMKIMLPPKSVISNSALMIMINHLPLEP